MWKSINCVFHDDSTASARINQREDRYYCHGCGVSMKISDIDEDKGVSRVTESVPSAGIVTGNVRAGNNRPTPLSPRATRLLEEAVARYESNASMLEAYLSPRGFTPEDAKRHRLGLVVDPVPGHEQMVGRMAIPYLTPAGPVTIRFRCICGHCKEAGHPKYKSLTGAQARLYGVMCLQESHHQSITITEGELDAISLQSMGMAAVGVPGANTWRPHYSRIMEDFSTVRVVGDGDKAGREFVAAVMHDVPEAIGITAPDGMDINDVYAQQGEQGIKKLLGVGE